MAAGHSNTAELNKKDAEAELAAKFLARADRILHAVDNAFIIRRRNHKPRLLPSFDRNELTIGKLLGTGGFGIVYEIDKFHLRQRVDANESKKDEVTKNGDSKQAATATAGEPSTNSEMEESFTEHDQQEAPSNRVARVVSVEPVGEKMDDDHIHYDVDHARIWMERQPKRNNSARYAIKHLKPNLTVLEQARGMVDLAVEAKFLQVIWHPNIIKIRGWARCENIINKDFFIILDRLHDTLDAKLKEWAALKKRYKGKVMGLIGSDKNGLNKLLVTRMTVAYDLASAFNYLHSNKLVYRDIKPENIGFDSRGNVKVFDFGLCKSLSRELRAKNFDYGYKLTGRAGSLPYMAPEVALMKTYDTKCDVFSFAILLWEILSLLPAFKEMKADIFVERVLMNKERLPVDKKWPPLTRLLIPEAWDDNPQLRPDMQRVAMLIRGDLNLMTNDETILRRTKHLNEQSMHSIRGQ